MAVTSYQGGKYMFSKVYIEDIGTRLIDNEIYVCKQGLETFEARFNYCPDEYWWTNIKTNKLTGVSFYKVKR